MNKEMIISSGDHETRVAILEDDQVVEVFIEREKQRGVVGNVYKGRVNKVLPGMQSSFIDIGLERDAFLYVSEVVNTVEEFERLAGDDEDEPVVALGTPPADVAGAADAADAASPVEAVADGGEPPVAGAAAPNARPERRRERGGPGERDDRPQAKIEDLLKEGQDILVQVVKEPLGTKGARLTSHVTMPGRFLVFMPTVDHVGVSRKIDSREERGRLRGIVREFREQHGFTGGVIIRTAAGGRSKEDIVSDLVLLPPGLDRDPPEDGSAPRAGAALPGAEPRHQAAARPADRRLHRHPARRPAGVPARRDARRAHHAEPRCRG